MPGVATLVGVDLFSAVGLSTAEVTVAVRGRSSRFTETGVRDIRFGPVVAAIVPEPALPPVPTVLDDVPLPTSRELRLARLAAKPLASAVSRLEAAGVRPVVFLAVPEPGGVRPVDEKAVLARVLAPYRRQIAPHGHTATFRGRAGGLAALGAAIDAVNSGVAPAAIVGGVDTGYDLMFLARLGHDRRLKTPTNSDGLIPGEAAAFVTVLQVDVAASLGMSRLARVGPVALGDEPGHFGSTVPYRGDGLAATVRALMTTAALDGQVREVFSTMNGESHWGKEWGVAFLRNREAFDPDHGMHHPADCYGDIGAASAPMLIGLAADGLARGYRRAPIMVYASSDSAPRAATIVAASSN